MCAWTVWRLCLLGNSAYLRTISTSRNRAGRSHSPSGDILNHQERKRYHHPRLLGEISKTVRSFAKLRQKYHGITQLDKHSLTTQGHIRIAKQLNLPSTRTSPRSSSSSRYHEVNKKEVSRKLTKLYSFVWDNTWLLTIGSIHDKVAIIHHSQIEPRLGPETQAPIDGLSHVEEIWKVRLEKLNTVDFHFPHTEKSSEIVLGN